MINFIRYLFRKHDSELIDKVVVYGYIDGKYQRKWIYRCKKCGHIQIIKDY